MKKYVRIVYHYEGKYEFLFKYCICDGIEYSPNKRSNIHYYSSYAEYSVNDYHLDTLIEENQYFIVSPKDIVVATLYEHDDRVKWFIEHE